MLAGDSGSRQRLRWWWCMQNAAAAAVVRLVSKSDLMGLIEPPSPYQPEPGKLHKNRQKCHNEVWFSGTKCTKMRLRFTGGAYSTPLDSIAEVVDGPVVGVKPPVGKVWLLWVWLVHVMSHVKGSVVSMSSGRSVVPRIASRCCCVRRRASL